MVSSEVRTGNRFCKDCSIQGYDDEIEDIQGNDNYPGKVILVSNTDTDGDGIPDYADGFDWNDNTTDDSTSAGTSFTPLMLTLPAGWH